MLSWLKTQAMGNTDSKLVFKQGILRLSDSQIITTDDPYWKSFWELPDSAEDVFSLFSPSDVKRARDNSLANIENLIHALTAHLFALRNHKFFPHSDSAPEKEALNCIRVLTRILPFLYEADHLESWEDKFFWSKRKRRTEVADEEKPEVLFEDAETDAKDKMELNSDEKETFELISPLGEDLVDALVDLLFYAGFTLPTSERAKGKVTYAIWQKGVGCTTPMGSSKEMESNRTEVLRLLLTLSSKSLYLPSHVLPVKGVKAITYITTCPDKQLVLSLLCSQLNTALNYNPATWRVPYDHVVYKDPKQILVTYSLQFLLVLLLYTAPDHSGGLPQKNYFRHFLGRLHRLQDFEFLADGMIRTLNQPLQATSSYLPGSQKSLNWAPEMIMLFWETLQCNKRFRSFVIDGDSGHQFMVLMLFYTFEYRTDPAKQGVVRMCVFVLQTLSTEPNFGKQLNRPLENQEAMPVAVKIPDFAGSQVDFLIISIHNLITNSKGKIDAIYPSLLATINNVAPYVEQLGSQATVKLLQLLTSMSSPSFLLANETNHTLLQTLLESINAIIEHQYGNNRTFVQGIFRTRKRFEALRTFTLESGRAEIERQEQRRKEAGGSHPTSPTRPLRSGSVDPVRNAQGARPTHLSNVPEDSTFSIGDDEDSDAETQSSAPATPSHSSPSNHTSRNPSISSIDDPLPAQLRGMSEKARGKMPANTPSFSRQNSTTSLSSHHATTNNLTLPSTGFEPTANWIDGWLPTLPLHTLLTVLSSSTSPKSLPSTIEPSPPRIQSFEWTPLSLGWYESLLWGFIFASEMIVQKGTVGVWNGTAVKLFRVETAATTGPSLMKPMGAVDAVGSRLVSGVKSLSTAGAARVSGGGGNESHNGRGRAERTGVRDV